MTTEAEALVGNDPRHKGKALLLHLTKASLYVSSNIEISAR